jgi:hypothetical protein
MVDCIQTKASLVKYSLSPDRFVASAKRAPSAVRFKHSCAYMVLRAPLLPMSVQAGELATESLAGAKPVGRL